MRIRSLTEIPSRESIISEIMESVKRIVDDVLARGLDAALEYSEKFDGVRPSVPIEPTGLIVPPEIDSAIRSLESMYSELTPPRPVEQIYMGIKRIVRWMPIRRVALYVPGGYISTLVHLAVPARVAGVDEIYVVTPPKSITGEFLATAKRLGVRYVIPIGGPQGVALVASGKGVPRVDKIVGPGNAYVQAAKYLVSRFVGIDSIEGPTEIAVYYEEGPWEVALLDALAQLEHGGASIALVVSPHEWFLEAVEREYSRLQGLGRLYTLLVRDAEEARLVIEEFAPEHASIYGKPMIVRTAGVISLNTPSPLLDYVAGPSHVLPTGGAGRWRGIITPMDFMKPITTIEADPSSTLVRVAIALAEMEGFKLHREALVKWFRGDGSS